MRRFRSILSRVVALHVIAIGVTSILIPLALYWLLNEAANSLHRDALRAQALTIASFLRPAPDGGVTLQVPQEARPIYSGGYALYARDILDVPPARVDLLEVNLRAGEVTAHPWDEDRLADIRERLRLSIRTMRAWLRDPAANAADLDDFERTEDLRLCRWCNFKAVCRPDL